MKTYICIEIQDDSIKNADLDYQTILNLTLNSLSELYQQHNLVFDCGYNPQLTTDCIN
jgi:hypothetical protein